MRIVFMGSPAAVLSPLGKLVTLQESGVHELVAVVSQPARPVGRKSELVDPPVAAFAKEHGLKVLQPEKASAEPFLEEFAALKPDIAVTAAYGQILSDRFLKIPRRATINLHPSLLPMYRGATPVPQALLDGATITGMTILFTEKKLDAGAIISQEMSAIAPDETAEALTSRMFALGAEMLPEAIRKLADPAFTGAPQDETRVSFCKKIHKEDGQIAWSLSAAEIFNRYRAYYPWPGAFTFCDERRVVIEKMLPAPSERTLAPGEFYFDKKAKVLCVGSGAGHLHVIRVKPAGAKGIDAAAFWNGLKLQGTGRFR